MTVSGSDPPDASPSSAAKRCTQKMLTTTAATPISGDRISFMT